MMRSLVRYTFALAILTAFVPGALAHSVEETQSMIGQDERYFQAIDKPAPDFTLRTADDRVVRLADFRDKVIVLHFIYTSCPDVCPPHAERIAEVQSMVNQTPMKERMQFITVTTDPTRDTPDVMR